MTTSYEVSASHALDGHDDLAAAADRADLWIDGTAEDDTYQGDAMSGPWVVFDIEAQDNVAGPFETDVEARASLNAVLKDRGYTAFYSREKITCPRSKKIPARKSIP